jgi:hypothetical protein
VGLCNVMWDCVICNVGVWDYVTWGCGSVGLCIHLVFSKHNLFNMDVFQVCREHSIII